MIGLATSDNVYKRKKSVTIEMCGTYENLPVANFFRAATFYFHDFLFFILMIVA